MVDPVKCCVCQKPYEGKDLPGLICGKCAAADIVYKLTHHCEDIIDTDISEEQKKILEEERIPS